MTHVDRLSPVAQDQLRAVLERPEDQRRRQRIIALSDRPLQAYAVEGSFSLDLYYRLAIHVITIPSLNHLNREDLSTLVDHILTERAMRETYADLVTTYAEEKLLAHCWRGNLAELTNVIVRALALSAGARIKAEHVVFLDRGDDERGERRPGRPRIVDDPAKLERARELRAMEVSEREIARRLSIPRSRLRSQLRDVSR